MIPEAVTIATIALAMGTYGRIAAANEAAMIRDRIDAGINEDLDHGALLRERIAIGATITLVLSMAYAWFLNLDGRTAVLTILAHALRLAFLGWASFTILHRLSLNGAREKPWWYCAPGNNYDWRFINLYLWKVASRKKRRRWAVAYHVVYWANAPNYRAIILKAGITMFAFEGLVAAVTITSLWW